MLPFIINLSELALLNILFEKFAKEPTTSCRSLTLRATVAQRLALLEVKRSPRSTVLWATSGHPNGHSS